MATCSSSPMDSFTLASSAGAMAAWPAQAATQETTSCRAIGGDFVDETASTAASSSQPPDETVSERLAEVDTEEASPVADAQQDRAQPHQQPPPFPALRAPRWADLADSDGEDGDVPHKWTYSHPEDGELHEEGEEEEGPELSRSSSTDTSSAPAAKSYAAAAAAAAAAAPATSAAVKKQFDAPTTKDKQEAATTKGGRKRGGARAAIAEEEAEEWWPEGSDDWSYWEGEDWWSGSSQHSWGSKAWNSSSSQWWPSTRRSGWQAVSGKDATGWSSKPTWGAKHQAQHQQVATARRGSGMKPQCQFFIGIEEDPKFKVTRKIMGPHGQHMKAIAHSTGAKLRLRGHGSGFLEGPEQRESTDELMLCVSAPDWENYSMAVQKVTELLEGIYEQYRESHPRKGADELGIRLHEGPRPGSR